jgi:hypothetical protein
MALHHDMRHFQRRHRVLHRRRSAMVGTIGPEGRHQIGDIAVNEELARSAPNIEVTCTRLSQHEITMARGCWPPVASLRYQALLASQVVACQP